LIILIIIKDRKSIKNLLLFLAIFF